MAVARRQSDRGERDDHVFAGPVPDRTCRTRESGTGWSVLYFNCASEVVAGGGIARLYAKGFLKLGDRIVNEAFLPEDDTQPVVGLGVIRVQADDLFVLAGRFVNSPPPIEIKAKVVVGIDMIRL